MKIFRKKILSLVLIFTIIVLSTGCTGQDKEKVFSTAGAVVGGVAGYFGGKAVGGKAGAIVGAAVGSIAVSYSAKWLSRYLDERDKQQAIEAAKDVLRNPNKKTVTWESRTNPGVKGSATTMNTAQNNCQNLKMMVFKNGKQHETTEKFCTDPDSGEMVPV